MFAPYRVERAIEVIRTSNLQGLKLDRQGLSRALRLFKDPRRVRIGGIPHYSHTREARKELFEQFQSLSAKVGSHEAQSRDVAPGRAKLGTSPVPNGSPAFAMTIGMVVVARLAARGARVPNATITLTSRETSSAASPGRRSSLFLANRPSNKMFFPSIQPNSWSPLTKMALVWGGLVSPALKKAIR